jgi:hypothetical protein
MAETQRDKIEYDFEDLRRNEDPIPDNVLDQLGLEDEDLTDDERHDDKKARDDKLELDDKDDEDAEMEDELDDDGEYNPAKMTNAMRKRLMKVKRDANRAIVSAKEEAGEEISKLTKRIAELEKTGKAEQLEDEFGGKLEDLEAQIVTAMEDGDSKKVATLTREMSELTADMRDKKRDLEQQRDEPDDVEDDEKSPKIIPRAAEWVKEQDWWDDSELGHVREFVRTADIALQKKGYKPTDDDFYEQLERVVEKKYPGVIVQTVDDEDLDLDDEFEEEDDFEDVPDKGRRSAKKKRRRRRSPVSEGDRGGVSLARKKLRKKRGKTLSAARVKNMEVFGMDPENPEHVEAYLDNNP